MDKCTSKSLLFLQLLVFGNNQWYLKGSYDQVSMT